MHPRGSCPKLCFLLPFFCFSAIGVSNHLKTSSIFTDFTKLFSSFDITQKHQIYPSQKACLIYESPPTFSSRLNYSFPPAKAFYLHFICIFLRSWICFFFLPVEIKTLQSSNFFSQSWSPGILSPDILTEFKGKKREKGLNSNSHRKRQKQLLEKEHLEGVLLLNGGERNTWKTEEIVTYRGQHKTAQKRWI